MFDLSTLGNFTFGIEIRQAPLIAFGDITTEHNIEHFQARLNDATLKKGRSFSLTESNRRSNVTPLFFRMFISGTYNIIVISVITWLYLFHCYVASNNVQHSQMICLESNNETTTKIPALTTTTDCSSCDETSQPGQAAVVGGALGGATAVALVAVAIISVCIVVLLVKQKRKLSIHQQSRFHNAISEGVLSNFLNKHVVLAT